MSSATATIFNGCLTFHIKTLFTPKVSSSSSSFLSLRSKPPINLRLSPFPSWVPLRNQYPSLSSSSVIALVSQTSNWAQNDQDTLVEEVEVELNWESQEEGKETEASLADWDGEGEESGGEDGLVEESYPEPPEEAKLFVGNLPYDVDSEQLAQLFDQAGTVEVAEVIYNRQTDQSRGFGFVTMSTVEEAEKAVEMFHRYDISGRLLTVNKAAPRGSRPELPPRTVEPSFRAYVGNLPWEVDNTRLEQIFSEHGEVVNARVVCERETGRSRGFGFVTMSTQSELDDAIAALDGQSMDGRTLKVNVAEERPRRAF